MKPIVFALPLGALLMLTACDRMQQKGPPPTYESSTLGTAQAISGAAPPAASAASAPAPKP
jgi:hypothetical protein